MADINIAFSRSMLKSVHEEVRKRFPSFNLKKDAWVYQSGGRGSDFWEFHGPHNFYVCMKAHNAYQARAEGWEAFLDMVDHDDSAGVLYVVNEIESGDGYGAYLYRPDAEGKARALNAKHYKELRLNLFHVKRWDAPLLRKQMQERGCSSTLDEAMDEAPDTGERSTASLT
jgi:hypothetical protein